MDSKTETWLRDIRKSKTFYKARVIHTRTCGGDAVEGLFVYYQLTDKFRFYSDSRSRIGGGEKIAGYNYSWNIHIDSTDTWDIKVIEVLSEGPDMATLRKSFPITGEPVKKLSQRIEMISSTDYITIDINY